MRYTLVIVPKFVDFCLERSKHEKVDFKTLKEAKGYFGILTDGEREGSYIFDNVTKKKVDYKLYKSNGKQNRKSPN